MKGDTKLERTSQPLQSKSEKLGKYRSVNSKPCKGKPDQIKMR